MNVGPDDFMYINIHKRPPHHHSYLWFAGERACICLLFVGLRCNVTPPGSLYLCDCGNTHFRAVGDVAAFEARDAVEARRLFLTAACF
jgi:hypothetical protein